MGCRPIKWKSPLLNFNSFYPTSLVHVSDSGLGTPAVLFNNSELLSVSHHLSLPLAVMVKLDPSTVSVALCQQTIQLGRENSIRRLPLSNRAISLVECGSGGPLSETNHSSSSIVFRKRLSATYRAKTEDRNGNSVCHVLCTRSRPNTPASHPHINFASLRIKILHSL